MNFFGTKYSLLCISTNGGVFPTNDPEGACSSYDDDVKELALSAAAPMVAVLALDIDNTECPTSMFTDTDLDGNFGLDELPIDDGFALPCSIYWGPTTVDGRDAIVVTWYRVPNNDAQNAENLTNTFQLLLIKRDTGNSTVGYDFDFEFNYATLTDDEDGYAVNADGTVNEVDDCDAYNNLVKSETYGACRWGIGVGNFTIADGASVGYEFFEQYSIGQLIDSGDTAMIKHRLGSTIDGRYRCGMINGVATGCDFSAALAETGTDNGQLALLGGLAALSMVAGAAVIARRRKA
jgi:LPXTG-motif cell wall-anchored protein